MKPVYLEFCGLNSFSEKAQIDFNALLSGGVFGIFGDTGSGKSTILDAVHFALYGEVDRVPKSFNDCINYRSEGASVVFDFEITAEGVRTAYRVKRERKRKTGTTKASLYQYTPENTLLALAETPSEVNKKVEELVGLSFDDFKTCIALPQGDFAALVKATPSERVKLVSRLFNLERYGERLSRAVNEKYKQAEEETDVIKARMEENAGGDPAKTETLEKETQTLRDALKILESRLETAETAYAACERACKEKAEYEKLKLRLQKMTESLPSMEKTRALLDSFSTAKTAVGLWEQTQKTKQDHAEALKNTETAKQAYATAVAERENREKQCADANYDERLLTVSLSLEKLQAAQANLQAEKTAKAALDDCIAEYRKIKDKCPEEDFEGERKRLQTARDALGDDATLLDYLKRNCKEVFLVDAYGEFRADLKTLSEKYPVAQAEAERLMRKYTLPISGETDRRAFDVAAVQLAFKENERKKQEYDKRLRDLEKRETDYYANEKTKKLLSDQGKLLRQQYELAAEQTKSVAALGSEKDLLAQKTRIETEKKTALANIDAARKKESQAVAEIEKWKSVAQLHQTSHEKAQKDLSACLAENAIDSVSAAQEIVSAVGDEKIAKERVRAFFEEYAAARAEYDKTDEKKFAECSDERLNALREAKETLKTEKSEKNRAIGANEKEIEQLRKLYEKYKEQAKALAEKEKKKNLYDQLRQLVRSNRFLEYIASEYLQEISVRAGKTLLSLTGGRYFLRYDKDFKVGDNFDGGNLRAVRTLSGGETFLVSLSLALSLSTAICAKSLRPIEFFFLDEGFGTLDEKLVDTVMDVLGKLSKTFAVGLISHVEELKRRIDNKVLVTGANEGRGSSVRVVVF